MLAPQLATMLVVLTTDAVVAARATSTPALRAATRVSFDRLDSDGCMSTNDTVTAAGQRRQRDHADARRLHRGADPGLHRPRHAAARATPRAPTTRSRSPCCNAATEDDAVEVGRSVARSNLFKAAVFGNDPNWGRVLASIGTTQAAFDPADLDVAMNGVWVCRQLDARTPTRPTVDLKPREVSVTIDLKAGDARATVWTNDLTHAYVHENSAYSS